MEWSDEIKHSKRWIVQKYQEVQKLTTEHEGRIDPNELDEKKFKAIKILMEIREVLTHCKETPCTVAATITNLNICMLQDHLHDTQLATKNFKKCIDLLEKSKLTSEGILPAISANNQLGLIYARRLGFAEEAEYFLKQAEDLYVKFTEDIKLDPVYMVPIMGIDEIDGDWCAKSILEKLHTLTLSYLANFYKHLGNKSCSALYSHRMLSSQLSWNKLTQDLDYENWAANAAIISEYFVEQDKFPQARHHLAAASCILEKYLEILKARGSRITSESIAATLLRIEYRHYDRRSASIARYWAKYGIALLEASRKRLVEEEDEDSKPAQVSGEVCKYPQTETMEDLRFVELEPELESITNKITDMYLLNSNDARSVFLNVRKWLDKAKEYYTFENHPKVYAWIDEDLSEVYNYLAFFEDNVDMKVSIFERQVDILEGIIERFCPRHYPRDSFFCGRICYFLGLTYREILYLKMEMNRLKPNVMSMVAKNCIKYFQSYLNSLQMKKSKEGVEFFSDLYLHSELDSYFYIGQLYNKIEIFDRQEGIENMQNSLDAFSFIVNYYDKHPEKQKELDKWTIVELSKEYISSLLLKLENSKMSKTNHRAVLAS